MKAIFFLLSAEQKIYIFLFNNPRNEDKMDRYEYTIPATLALDLLISKEGGICGNRKSTNKNRGGRGFCQKKGSRDTPLINNVREAPMEAQKKMKH